MKITLLKISIIFIFLISYGTLETIFLNRFSDDFLNMVSMLQAENNIGRMYEIYAQMQQYMDKSEFLLDFMISKNEQEIICVSLGRIRDYLQENKEFEARVAAGEIKSYLAGINTPFATKK